MWKRLSRLWKRAEPDLMTGVSDRYAAEPPPPVAASEPEVEVAKSDPLVGALARFDAAYQEAGAEGVGELVRLIRELVIQAPTDARVLRRAGELARALGDAVLASELEMAATSSSGAPLAELGHSFLAMDDAELALVLGDGAVARAGERQRRGRRAEALDDDGLAAGRLIGALALSRMGEHGQVLERLEHALDDGVAARVRWALAALALGDRGALARVEGELGPAEAWIGEVRARLEAFPSASEGYSSDPQRLLFSLYGSVLLDDADDGERLGADRLMRWLMALATLVREVLPEGTRPSWVSPKSEVLARWLASFLSDDAAAMPLSARLPKQPVLVMLADDDDLASVVASRGWGEGRLPVFQAVKDPREIGSPMADVIGVFRGDIELPFEELEAERAQDRQPPKMLLGKLLDMGARESVNPSELEGFLGWVRARRAYLSLANPPPGDERIPLDVARDL